MPTKQSLQTCLALCFWCAALSVSAQDDSEFEALSAALQNPPALALPMSAIPGHWKSAMRSISGKT